MREKNFLTLKQYMDIDKIFIEYPDDDKTRNVEIVKYLYGNLDITKKDMDELIYGILNIRLTPAKFQRTFTYKGINYGFVPDLDKISSAEWMDIDSYDKNPELHLHRICAILYRPIIAKEGQLYRIEKYEGSSKYSDIMLDIDSGIAVGAMVFFWNLRMILLNHSVTYTQQMAKTTMKEIHMHTSTNQKRNYFQKKWDGIQCYMRQRMGIS